MYRNSKKGFITVEAAIFLPIFIIGVLTFAYQIKFMAVQEMAFHALTDEARVLSAEARVNPINTAVFELKLKDRIYHELGSHVESVNIDKMDYLYASRGLNGFISMDLNYDVKIKLPVQFVNRIPVSESILLRGFIGKKERNDPLPFEEMEQWKESQLVWVFPRAGEKYHREDCICITSEPRQAVMTNRIRHSYDPCSICNSKGVANGSLIYCFRTGRAYHTGACPIVDKYVRSIEKEDAIQRGYEACSKCCGD